MSIAFDVKREQNNHFENYTENYAPAGSRGTPSIKTRLKIKVYTTTARII